jgi:methylated-DNA-[protein]-cysteine S-methyltransferase
MDTPAGKIFIKELRGHIIYIGFEDPCQKEVVTPLIRRTKDELSEYFNGERKEFTVPVAVYGISILNSVCDSLQKIPYGETRTYKEIAEDIGKPKAIRAVATAIGNNPVSIIIPCHRVIGSDGEMRGYAGGIPFKEFLLEVEGRTLQK